MNKIDLVAEASEKAFLAEDDRSKKIGERAEKFIGAAAVLASLQVFQGSRLSLSGTLQEVLAGWLTIAGLLALGLSLVLTLISMQVRNYYSFPRGTALIDELRDEALSDDAARIKIARMYLSARDINARINDSRARLLVGGGVLLVVGFLLAVVSQVIARPA